jgi:hypothetical protein
MPKKKNGAREPPSQDVHISGIHETALEEAIAEQKVLGRHVIQKVPDTGDYDNEPGPWWVLSFRK